MKTSSGKPIVKSLVERGYTLHLQIARLSEEFKSIKDQLKAEALRHPQHRIPLQDDQSPGTQWIAFGKGCECRIVFPGPKLMSQLDAEHPDLPVVKNLLGTHFPRLFQSMTYLEPVSRPTLRKDLTEIVSPMATAQILELLSVPSEPKALWRERHS